MTHQIIAQNSTSQDFLKTNMVDSNKSGSIYETKTKIQFDVNAFLKNKINNQILFQDSDFDISQLRFTYSLNKELFSNPLNTTEQLKSYKKSYQFLAGIRYKEMTKYDLGLVGKYLGVSRNIAAIILAILSL